MWNYAIYGPRSPFNDIVSNDDLKKINPTELTDIVKTLTTYPHKLFYFGPSPLSEVKGNVEKFHKIPEKLTAIPEEKNYPELNIPGKQVYLVNYDMSQANLILVSKGEPFSEDVYIKSNLFNQYFGNSMSSIVFQEIREAQGMSYSAWLGYNAPSNTKKSFAK
jgi:predicted Zn-dependent peptidase